MIFCLFHCFHQRISKKHWILPQYTFFWKKKINDVFLNVFRNIKGILNKTPFYKYNICNLNKEENSAYKVTFSRFLYFFNCWWKKIKKYILYLENIFFSKIAQITYFYAFILILRQYIYFSLKQNKWPVFQWLSEIYYF